jgi:hypothetical protein
MTLKGNKTVQSCLQSKLERKSKWTRKSSTIVKSTNMIVELVSKVKILTTTSQTTQKQNIMSAKRAIKSSIKDEVKDTRKTTVQKLTMQGDLTHLLIEEQSSVTWQSIIRKMPRNVMSFASRLCTNSLNSPDNLVRWGKRNKGS